MDSSFKIGSREFKLGKINPLTQFHIVRRIGPILTGMLEQMQGVTKTDMSTLSEAEKLAEFAKIGMPLMKGLSKMSDDQANYVLFRLLAAVEVHQPQHSMWARVANENQI